MKTRSLELKLVSSISNQLQTRFPSKTRRAGTRSNEGRWEGSLISTAGNEQLEQHSLQLLSSDQDYYGHSQSEPPSYTGIP